MIWEEFVSYYFDSPSAQVGNEGLRVADGTEREYFSNRGRRDVPGCPAFSETKNAIQFRACVENRGFRLVANRRFYGRRVFAARNHDYICASQCGTPLAQSACRKQAAPAEWLAGVDEHDIHVARELKVLKTVIEDEPIHALQGEEFAVGIAIRADAELRAITQP